MRRDIYIYLFSKYKIILFFYDSSRIKRFLHCGCNAKGSRYKSFRIKRNNLYYFCNSMHLHWCAHPITIIRMYALVNDCKRAFDLQALPSGGDTWYTRSQSHTNFIIWFFHAYGNYNNNNNYNNNIFYMQKEKLYHSGTSYIFNNIILFQ